jgi:RimJ/RimL family protein N-acetyltransferase
MIDPDAGWRTERLALEPLMVESAEELFAVLDDPELHRYLGGAPLTRDDLARRYERLATRLSPDGSQVWANWLVRELATGSAVGTLQATLPAAGPTAGPAEVAWVIGLARQGRGLAGEAAQSLVARLESDGWQVVAHIHPEHLASQGVARRAGLVATGEMVDGEVRYVGRRPALHVSHL